MSRAYQKFMSLVTLGTRGNIKERRPRYKNHSGLLLDNSLLFDFGEEKFLKCRPRAIFITHLHPDHACFMLQDIGVVTCPIFAPNTYEEKPTPDVHALNKTIKMGAFRITPIPTVHSFKTPSQGYLVEGKGKKIFYSGDIITIEKEHLKKMKRVDVVITEASFFRHKGMIHTFDSKISGHNGVRELIELFRPFTKRIIFMHYGSWFVQDLKAGKKTIHELGDEALLTEASYDGKKFLV